MHTDVQFIKSKRININSEEARRIIARITEYPPFLPDSMQYLFLTSG